MKKLAIIPARGGSKRIPRKNVKDFLGAPIITYSIQSALKSQLFDEVMVSTDDKEIAEIAKKYGAQVPFLRSAQNSDDHATTADVILEVLDAYQKTGEEFDLVCCIYPTAPLISVENLSLGCSKLIEKGLTSVFPVVSFSYPIWRSLKLSEKGEVRMNWPEYEMSRSQDLPVAYHDAGQFYWLKVTDFLIERRLFSERCGVLVLNDAEVQDIDNFDDWELAEIKMKLLATRSLQDSK